MRHLVLYQNKYPTVEWIFLYQMHSIFRIVGLVKNPELRFILLQLLTSKTCQHK